MPNLYALLVGIDSYNSVNVSSLSGCVNDVTNMQTYLESRSDFELDLQILTNNRATKYNIVNGIENHLGKAGKDDVALFYFAGHGVLEETSIPAFQHASVENRLQTFICYDSAPLQQKSGLFTCLADKELRYLIYKISQSNPHIVLICDCCHSGSISRYFRNPPPEKKARTISVDKVPERAWEGFIFHDRDGITQAALHENLLDEVIPEGEHIQFAACRDVELAWEHTNNNEETNGLFTLSLLKILQEAGNGITYYDLKLRLTNFMRDWKVKNQSPQFYPCSLNPHIIYQPFLGGEIQLHPTKSSIIWNPSLGWTIPLGEIHGMNRENIGQPLSVFSEKEEVPAAFKIKEVRPAICLVAPYQIEPDQNKSYQCEVKIVFPPIKVFFRGEEKNTKLISELETIKEIKNTAYFDYTDQEETADYVIEVSQGKATIMLSGDHKALIKSLPSNLPNFTQLLYHYLWQISWWNFILHTSPKRTSLHKGSSGSRGKYPVEMKMFRGNLKSPEEIPIDHRDHISLDLTQKAPNGNPCEYVGIKLINHSPHDLYCCLIYMSMTFGADTRLLPEEGFHLLGGNSVWLAQGSFIPVTQDTYIYQDNWEGAREYFKLIISTEEFDTRPFLLEDLPAPYGEYPHKKPHSEEEPVRKFNFSQPAMPKEAWTAWRLEVFTRNPRHKSDYANDIPKENL